MSSQSSVFSSINWGQDPVTQGTESFLGLTAWVYMGVGGPEGPLGLQGA